jgi:leucine dehydrogenase
MNSLQIEELPEFDNHRIVSFVFDKSSGLCGFIAIHRGGSGIPAFGATRLWDYRSEDEALRDALRLSKMMSYKSAIAGLKYGGAKATIMAVPKALDNRNALFKAYAGKVQDLSGRFITGTDVGVNDKDVKLMKKFTPYVVGSKLDPAYFTAVGVFYGIQESLNHVFGNDSLDKRTFAFQGIGKTGSKLIELIYEVAGNIYVTDIDQEKIRKIVRQFPKVNVVSPAEIHRKKVDIFVPAALSGALNSKSVSELRCKIIVGSANNQLTDDHVGELLHKLGVLYAPDYVVNAGGLISVVDEYENKSPSEKRILRKLEGTRETLRKIFNRSKKENRATNRIADEMAETVFNNGFQT